MIRSLALTILILLHWTAPSLHGAEPAGQPSTSRPLRLVQERHDAVQFLGWEGDETLSFRSPAREGNRDGQVLHIELQEVVRYGRGAAARGGQGLLLVDGSLLAGRVNRITDTECIISGRYFNASIPRPLVRAVLLAAPPIDGLQAQIIRDAFSAVGGDDIVIGVDGDRTTGALQATAAEDAVVWERGGDALEMVQGGRPIRLAISRVRALIFSPLLTPIFGAEADATTVGLADGTRMQVGRTHRTERTDYQGVPRRAETEAVRFELLCGAQIAAPARRWSPAAVVYISPRRIGGAAPPAAVRRLNDQPPLRLRVQPMFGEARDVDDNEINEPPVSGVRVGGHWYGNTIAMPSGAQAVYRGPASGGYLRADVAIRDPEAPDAAIGSVRLRVLVVGEAGQLREVWKSEMIRGGQGLVAVDVPLPATPAVVLTADPADRGGAGDRAVWIDPVVMGR